MRFVHFSDIRLGSPSESGTNWAESRDREKEDTLKRALSEAEFFGADLALISGGLFSHIPSAAELDKVSGIFSGFPEIRVVITAGEHDPVCRSSPVLSYVWPENVCFFLKSAVERVAFPEIGTAVYGASVTDQGNADAEDFKLGDDEDCPVRIAVLSSGNEEALRRTFAGSDFSYVAAGGGKQSKKSIAMNIWNPGCAEPETMREGGEHGILEGSVDDQSGVIEKVEFKAVASVSYVPLLVKTSARTGREELLNLIEGEIVKRGSRNIYRLKIEGRRNPSEVFDLSPLTERYRISEILDETEPEYDYMELFSEHPQDLIGFYISRILGRNREMSAVENKAIYYGLDALLKTSDAGGGRI